MRWTVGQSDGWTAWRFGFPSDSPTVRPSVLVPILLLLPLLACDPATSRPSFLPLPQADTLVLKGQPGQVAGEAASWLTAQGIVVERWSDKDAYVETAWYDTTAKRATKGEGDLNRLLSSVKIRGWADPGAPGQTRLTLELVYRPFYDPSQPPRDREVPLMEKGGARAIVDSLMAALKKRLGVPGAVEDTT
jgi:hypothetical protein